MEVLLCHGFRRGGVGGGRSQQRDHGVGQVFIAGKLFGAEPPLKSRSLAGRYVHSLICREA